MIGIHSPLGYLNRPLKKRVGFNFTSFSGVTDFQFNGNASIVGSELQLTQASPDKSSTVFYKTPFVFTSTNSFRAYFSWYTGTTGGADGFLFAVHNATAGASAFSTETGDAMGYIGKTSPAIDKSFAVVFDSYYNTEPEKQDHVSGRTLKLIKNGSFINVLQAKQCPVLINDGQTHHCWVDYDGSTQMFYIYLSNTPVKPAVGSHDASQSTNLRAELGANQLYVGFGAGTGGLFDSHFIKQFSFSVY